MCYSPETDKGYGGGRGGYKNKKDGSASASLASLYRASACAAEVTLAQHLSTPHLHDYPSQRPTSSRFQTPPVAHSPARYLPTVTRTSITHHGMPRLALLLSACAGTNSHASTTYSYSSACMHFWATKPGCNFQEAWRDERPPDVCLQLVAP